MAAAMTEAISNRNEAAEPVLGPASGSLRQNIGKIILSDVARRYGVPADKAAVEAYEQQNPGLALRVTMDAIRARLGQSR